MDNVNLLMDDFNSGDFFEEYKGEMASPDQLNIEDFSDDEDEHTNQLQGIISDDSPEASPSPQRSAA